MSLETHIVTAPFGERDLLLIKLEHATWGTPLRYADSIDDVVISGDGTYTATGGDADASGTDDSGVDSRSVTLPDPDLTLWRRLEELSRTGDTASVTVTLYLYLTTDLTTPEITAVYSMASPSRDGRMVTFDASTVDTINRDAPSRKFTWANSPGLRR